VNSRIKDEAFSEVLVFDKDKLIGIFSPSRASMIVPSKDNMGQMRIENLAKPINPVDETAELSEITAKMLGTGYNLIPVSGSGKKLGIVHIFDLLDAISPECDGLTVSDMELQKPVELPEDERVGKAIQILQEDLNSTILVKDKDNEAVGTLNHYDLLRNLKLDSYKEDRQSNTGYKSQREDRFSLPISEFIKDKNFISVNSKDGIPEVIEQFKANKVTSLIVEDTSLLISSADILNNLAKRQVAQKKDVEFVGLEKLEIDELMIASIKNTIQRSFEKIKDIIQQDANLKVQLKRYFAAVENKQHKYSVVLHLGYSGKYLSIDNVSEWDLMEAVKKAMNELENRINKIFRSQGVEGRDSPGAHNKERNG
jgi:ribosome-associated translation inhibitor RaiA/small nuclear ribonucleoprotein (snRNP)-like protein